MNITSTIALAYWVLFFVFVQVDLYAPTTFSSNEIYIALSFLAMAVLMFAWYKIDAKDRDYPASRLLDLGVIIFGPISITYYRIRATGWKLGIIFFLKLLAAFGVFCAAVYITVMLVDVVFGI